jgi:hypothetical protein
LKPIKVIGGSPPDSSSRIKVSSVIRKAALNIWEYWKTLMFLFILNIVKLQPKRCIIQLKDEDAELTENSKSKTVNISTPEEIVKVPPSVNGINRPADIGTQEGVFHRNLSQAVVHEAAATPDPPWDSPSANGGSVNAVDGNKE